MILGIWQLSFFLLAVHTFGFGHAVMAFTVIWLIQTIIECSD
jgi:hypothetical protein